MVSQAQSGKGFEYAMLLALQDCLGFDNCLIAQSSATSTAEEAFNLLDEELRADHGLACRAASKLLLYFEPNLLQVSLGQLRAKAGLQTDRAGEGGDVRDLLVSIESKNWEIGISAKHNHEALKHPRLSSRIDFGEKWFGLPCSNRYFAKIEPIFRRLEDERRNGLLWSLMVDKTESVYIPLLAVFRDELLALDSTYPGKVASGLVSYLIGHEDFYKIVKLKNTAKVQVFNFNGSLNRRAGTISPAISLDKLKLPGRIVELSFRTDGSEHSDTTLDMICDAGWQLSFRIHNASSRVEPSLKFDINLVGRPNNLETFVVGW